MSDPVDLCRNDVFKLASFRPNQRAVIDAMISGAPVMALLPTGGGKSLCYQLPAVLSGKLTIVISPLIALMRDQVLALQAKGIAAAALTSDDTEGEQHVWAQLEAQSLSLLYLSPERFLTMAVQRHIKHNPPHRVVVDEAHCIEAWGHDFRPEYLEIGKHLKHMTCPVAAFTATAATDTLNTICESLFLAPPTVFRQPAYRQDIHLTVTGKQRPREQVLALVHNMRGKGVVFCSTRRKTESLARALTDLGKSTTAYHAGLDRDERRSIEAQFGNGDLQIIVATIAFGMGVDIPDIRWVIHADMPPSPERLLQEIGRASRDGKGGQAFTLFGLEDIWIRQQQITVSALPPEQKWRENGRLNAMLNVALCTNCRAQTLAKYFGDILKPCGQCDNCVDPPETISIRVAIPKTIATKVKLTDQDIKSLCTAVAHDTGFSGPQIRLALAANDCIRSDGEGQWRLTSNATATSSIKVPASLRDVTPFRAIREHDVLTSPRYAKLVARRQQIANRERLPLYRVMHDDLLETLAQRSDLSIDELAQISGIGHKRLSWFKDLLTPDIQLHPSREKIAGQDIAALHDALATLQNTMNADLPPSEKPLNLSRSQLTRVAKAKPRDLGTIERLIGARYAKRFGEQFLLLISEY